MRAVVFLAIGGLYFLAVLYLPAGRNNSFLISFLISLFAGLVSSSTKNAVLALILFVLGAAFGVIFGVIVKAGFAVPVEKGQLIYTLTKIALITQLLGVLPWIIGVPMGWLARRKLIRH